MRLIFWALLLYGLITTGSIAADNSHPLLAPYRVYAEISTNLSAQTDGIIAEFIRVHPDTPLANKLRKRWLWQLAKAKHWDRFEAFYLPGLSQDLDCLYRYSRYRKGDTVTAFADLDKLWLVEHSQPPACNHIFKAWTAAGNLSQTQIRQRLKLSLKAQNYQLANYLIKQLPGEQQKKALKSYHLLTHPNAIAKQNPASTALDNLVLSHALARLGRRHPTLGLQQFKRFKAQRSFTAEEQANVLGAIALRKALRHQHDALILFEKIPPQYYHDRWHEWRIRAALRAQDWKAVLRATHQLPPHLAQEIPWQYWQGVAWEQLGYQAQAARRFETLSQKQHYYGMISAHRLGKKVIVHHHDYPKTQRQLQRIVNVPAMQRAYLLEKMGRRHEAYFEWHFALKQFNEQDRYLAAYLAYTWGWYGRAIFASKKLPQQDDLVVRFPMPYTGLVTSFSRKNNLPPAFVYALMRQESAFAPHARSRAGALGLMQLMPKTAARTAKKHKIPYQHTRQLLKPPKNIALGTHHLRDLRRIHKGHFSLMSAAYNAGSGRVKRWLPRKPMAAAIWIETIPWGETRRYVKYLLAHFVIYENRLGNAPDLSRFLRLVPKR
jgi:peptidoglycan lytic transglycosylase